MTSLTRVGRGVQDSPQKRGHYRVGQGRSKMAKKRRTSLMNVPLDSRFSTGDELLPPVDWIQLDRGGFLRF